MDFEDYSTNLGELVNAEDTPDIFPVLCEN